MSKKDLRDGSRAADFDTRNPEVRAASTDRSDGGESKSARSARYEEIERGDALVESFSIGYCSCPHDHRDAYCDAWLDSHQADEALIYAAMTAINVVEEIHQAQRSRRLAGRN